MGEQASERRVALLAGGTRGAGRAIAVELARTGLFVYATGRSSRGAGPSEIGRPETIEETGELMEAAGGEGAALVADHEDPGAVGELVARIERECGRLDVLVNDIFGGDRYMEWDKPLWEHDWEGGLRHLRGECRVPAERRLLLMPSSGGTSASTATSSRPTSSESSSG